MGDQFWSLHKFKEKQPTARKNLLDMIGCEWYRKMHKNTQKKRNTTGKFGLCSWEHTFSIVKYLYRLVVHNSVKNRAGVGCKNLSTSVSLVFSQKCFLHLVTPVDTWKMLHMWIQFVLLCKINDPRNSGFAHFYDLRHCSVSLCAAVI